MYKQMIDVSTGCDPSSVPSLVRSAIEPLVDCLTGTPTDVPDHDRIRLTTFVEEKINPWVPPIAFFSTSLNAV